MQVLHASQPLTTEEAASIVAEVVLCGGLKPPGTKLPTKSSFISLPDLGNVRILDVTPAKDGGTLIAYEVTPPEEEVLFWEEEDPLAGMSIEEIVEAAEAFYQANADRIISGEWSKDPRFYYLRSNWVFYNYYRRDLSTSGRAHKRLKGKEILRTAFKLGLWSPPDPETLQMVVAIEAAFREWEEARMVEHEAAIAEGKDEKGLIAGEGMVVEYPGLGGGFCVYIHADPSLLSIEPKYSGCGYIPWWREEGLQGWINTHARIFAFREEAERAIKALGHKVRLAG